MGRPKKPNTRLEQTPVRSSARNKDKSAALPTPASNAKGKGKALPLTRSQRPPPELDEDEDEALSLSSEPEDDEHEQLPAITIRLPSKAQAVRLQRELQAKQDECTFSIVCY